MKTIFKHLLFLLATITCLSAKAQLTTQILDNRISFQEGGQTDALLIYNGLDLTLNNNEFSGNLNLEADRDINLSGGDDIALRTNNIRRLFIDQDGRVGIGTSVPAAHAEVSNNSATGFAHLLLSETGASDFARLSFRNTGSSGNDFWDLAGKAAGVGNAPVFHVFYFDGTSGANLLSVDGNDKRVGINNGNPGSTLDINHPTSPSNSIFSSGNGLSVRNTGSSGTTWLQYAVNSDGSYAWFKNSNAVKAQIDGNNGNWVPGSDRKLKKNIKALNENQLEKIMALRPTSYQFKNQESDRITFGLIAQEVQDVYPEIVVPMGEGSEQLGVSYTELIPVLIAGMQEQQTQIDERDEKIEQLKKELSEIKAMLVQLADGGKVNIANQTSTLTSATLEQNQPNPFTENTLIRYFIPEAVKTASLRVTNLEGKQIREIPIQHRGQGQVTLQSHSLSAGNYQYTLILDGKILASKQMVLTKN